MKPKIDNTELLVRIFDLLENQKLSSKEIITKLDLEIKTNTLSRILKKADGLQVTQVKPLRFKAREKILFDKITEPFKKGKIAS